MHFFLVPVAISAMQKQTFSRIHAEEAKAFLLTRWAKTRKCQKRRESQSRDMSQTGILKCILKCKALWKKINCVWYKKMYGVLAPVLQHCKSEEIVAICVREFNKFKVWCNISTIFECILENCLATAIQRLRTIHAGWWFIHFLSSSFCTFQPSTHCTNLSVIYSYKSKYLVIYPWISKLSAITAELKK